MALTWIESISGQIIQQKNSEASQKMKRTDLETLSNNLNVKLNLPKKIKANFSWRRASINYGMDVNQNGIIDLPNSMEYLTNEGECPCDTDVPQECQPKFNIIFDPSATEWPRIDGFITREERENILRNRNENSSRIPELEHLPTSDRESAAIMHAKFRNNMRDYKWTINGLPVQMDQIGFDKIYAYCLAEGEHEVKLTAIDNYTGEEGSITQVIWVEDFLLVSIGDSYASGEGNPERGYSSTITIDRNSIDGVSLDLLSSALWTQMYDKAARTAINLYKGKLKNVNSNYSTVGFSVWADDGTMPTLINKTFEVSNHPLNVPIYSSDEGWVYHQIPVSYSATIEGMPDFDNFSEINRIHDRAHRSSFCSTSQVALELENKSDKYSVTYMNLAMSGATTNIGLIGDYDGLTNSRFFDGSQRLNSQLDELVKIVGKRTIDALTISIGGNDIGFANATKAYVVREPGSVIFSQNFEIDDIIAAVNSGDWSTLENEVGRIYLFNVQDELNWSNTDGLDALAGLYVDLAEKLENLTISDHVKDIYLLEYPDPTSEIKDIQNVNNVDWCAPILQNIQSPLEIGQAEIRSAYYDILLPLNAMIREKARELEWNLIPGIQNSSIGNGICAGRPYHPNLYSPSHPVQLDYNRRMRWFRPALASSVIQNEGVKKTSGTLHPNEFGHCAIKDKIIQSISQPQF